jgi:hypothetical protein
MSKKLFEKGKSGNPGGRPKCKYDLRLLKDGILDKFGGIPGFVNYWYNKDKRYLSDWLKEFAKKEVKVDDKQPGNVVVEIVDQFLYADGTTETIKKSPTMQERESKPPTY